MVLPVAETVFDVTLPLVVTNSLYADNDVYGTALTFTNLVRGVGTGGRLTRVRLLSLDRLVASDVKIALFKQALTTSTVTDNVAFVKTDVDSWNLLDEVVLNVLGGIEGDAATCFLEKADLNLQFLESSGAAQHIIAVPLCNDSGGFTPSVAGAFRLQLSGYLY